MCIAIVTTFDTIRCSTLALPAHNLAALGHPKAAASLPVEPFFCAVLICFYGTIAKCFEALEHVYCYSDNI